MPIPLDTESTILFGNDQHFICITTKGVNTVVKQHTDRECLGEGHRRNTRLATPAGDFSNGGPRNFSSPEPVNLRGHADPFRVQGSPEKLGRPRATTRNEKMPAKERGCALLADRHLGLMEGVRGLLETEFEAVVVVGDEVSLFESVRQLHVALAMVDLSLRRGDGLGLI